MKFLCPAQVYQYDAGFARFCNVKYSSQAGELNNPFIHLTNVAIQKHNDDYNVKHGGKWNLQHVRLFVEATWGREAQGRKRVIQRRFNVSVPRARVAETASTLRERSER